MFDDHLEHLKKYHYILMRKSKSWKVHLAMSVDAAYRKLRKYDPKSESNKRQVYAFIAVLDPMLKLQFFRDGPMCAKVAKAIKSEFRKRYISAYDHLKTAYSQDVTLAKTYKTNDADIAAFCRQERKPSGVIYPQLDRYLQSSPMTDRNHLAF